MNILLVSTEFPPSPRSAGIGSYTSDLAHGLSDLGHMVVVLTAKINDRNLNEFKSNFKIIEIDEVDFYVGRNLFSKVINKFRNFFYYDKYRKSIATHIDKLHNTYNFDILEIPEYGNEGKYWLPIKEFPAVVRFHGPSSLNRFKGILEPMNKRQNDELASLKYADSFSFVSAALKDVVLSKDLINLLSIPTFVVPNNVRITPPKCDFSNNSSECFKIIGAGSLGSIKGWDLLIEACETLNNKGFKIQLELYGRYADLEKYLKVKQQSNAWIKVYGHIDRNELFNKYKKADLCCFPSWFEPMGLTVLEAMGCGGLVLASEFGGWSELVDDGYNGFTMNPNEGVEELSNKIKKIINLDEKLITEIRSNGQDKVSNEYSPENFLSQTLNVYEKTIDNWEK